jgi:membrane protein implicated in regulation of membrane protease activity
MLPRAAARQDSRPRGEYLFKNVVKHVPSYAGVTSMDSIFFWCAIVGGTVLVCQFVMTLIGLGDGHPDFDAGGAVHFDHFDAGSAGHAGHADAAGHVDGGDQAAHHDSTWFFGIITFRTLVAAVTFFGLAGLWAGEQEVQPLGVLVIAVGAGIAAMFGVYYVMRSLTKLDTDGTLRIERAVGKPGTVYLPVPANKSGAGKIHIKLQNQLVELQAMTPHDRLPQGANVVVTSVIGPDTVEVALPTPTEVTAHA